MQKFQLFILVFLKPIEQRCYSGNFSISGKGGVEFILKNFLLTV